MADHEQLDVIAVGAHPDDVEIGCGGTLAKLVDQGYRVGIIDLTDGEPTPVSTGPEVRLAEAKRAADILGAAKRITFDFPNRKLMDGEAVRFALATEFRRYRPRLVLGLGDRTPLASPDHWQAMQITEAALFYSRLTKWDDQFAGTSPHRIEGLLYYTLELYSLEPPPRGNHFIFDISGKLETKLAAVRAYGSQFPAEKQGIFDRLEAVSRYFGEAAGFKEGERLSSPRAVGVRDLFAML